MFEPRSRTSIGAVAVARRRRAAQTLFVGRLVADDRDVLQAASSRCSVCSSACDEMSIRWTRAEPPRRLQRFGEQHQLLAAAAPELDDRRASSSPSAATISRVPREQAASPRA